MTYSAFQLPTKPEDQEPVVHKWVGEADPKAILVIAHGMGEHARRYRPLAERMVEEGYVVYAPDHRGHGLTVRNADQLGDYGQGGWNALVADIIAVMRVAQEENPGLPLLVMGHSMGSMAVQHLITEASDYLAGAALSGTTAVDVMADAAADPDVDVFALMNAAFEPVRTESDWLSRDEKQVDLYIADPLCGFTVNDASSASLAEAGRAYSQPDAIAAINKALPIYIFAGDQDPVGLNGELVKLVASRYQEAGIQNVELKLYEGARHEVFNETNRGEVVEDFVAWANKTVEGK